MHGKKQDLAPFEKGSNPQNFRLQRVPKKMLWESTTPFPFVNG